MDSFILNQSINLKNEKKIFFEYISEIVQNTMKTIDQFSMKKVLI